MIILKYYLILFVKQIMNITLNNKIKKIIMIKWTIYIVKDHNQLKNDLLIKKTILNKIS